MKDRPPRVINEAYTAGWAIVSVMLPIMRAPADGAREAGVPE